MIISKTKFTLKSWRLYFQFFRDTYRVIKQIKKSGGIVHIRIKPFSLRTISSWKTEKDMLDFRNRGAHLDAMKKSRSFGVITSTTWESDIVPNWKQAIKRLAEYDAKKTK